MDTGYILVTITFAVAAVAFLLGLVIVREGPRQRLNWITAGMLFCGGAGALLGAIDFIAALREAKILRAQGGLVRNFAFLWEFFFPTFLLFTLYFPTERRVVRRAPWLGWMLFLPYLFHFALLLAGSDNAGRFRFLALAERYPSLEPILDFAGLALFLLYRLNAALFPLVNLAAMLGATWLLASAYRDTPNPRLRVQVRIVLAGLGGCLALYSIATLVPVLTGFRLSPVVRATLIVSGLTLGSLAIAYAIVRHRFLDVQMLARRSILYGAATAAALALYIVLVRRLNVAIAGFIGIEADYIQTAVLVVALLLFQPLVARLEDVLEQVMLGDRADYRNVLRGLSRDVSTVLDLGDLGRKVGDMLAGSMMVDCGCLIVRPAPGSPLVHVAGFGRQEADPVLIRALEERVISAGTSDLVDADELLAGTGLVPPVRFMLVPLRHGGELLGLLLLGRKVTGTGFNAEDRALLATLGDQIGVAIKNAHLHRASVAKTLLDEELSFARNVQQSFLPAEFPPMPPLDLWAHNVPSKVVSGDYYDVVPIGEHEVLIAIGDVSGKGVPAALLMSMLRASLRTQAREPINLCEMMRSLNRLIFESTSEREFVTLFLARVDCRGLRVRYSNGGHNPPLLRREDGRLERLDRGGLLLGAFDGVEFEEGEVHLDRRDMLVLYTDGLTEAVDSTGDMFGDERLEAAVRALDPGTSARDLLFSIEGACRIFSDGIDFEDDLTVLVLRVDGECGANGDGAEAGAEAGGVRAGGVPASAAPAAGPPAVGPPLHRSGEVTPAGPGSGPVRIEDPPWT